MDLLVSPGKLSAAHRSLAGIHHCADCHTEKKRADPAKCLACHLDLAVRIRSKRGYHRDKGSDCFSCHPEHQGEDFRLVEWDTTRFDHDEAGWKLAGLHRQVACAACHLPANAPARGKGRSYLVRDARCAACHKDPHGGQLGAACDKCHGMAIPFKQVDYRSPAGSLPPERGPRRVAWREMPPGQALDGAAVRPVQRLPPKTPTVRRSGAGCRDCHREESWKTATFNHELTSYPLRGKHAALACAKCHVPGAASHKLAHASCRDCHRTTPHGTQFSQDCGSCHTVAGFKKASLDHGRTRYPLLGKHLGVACEKCHRPGPDGKTVAYRPLSTACQDCHRDVHLGQFASPCDACHTVAGFARPTMVFDHQKRTAYPLQGAHQRVACEKCHARVKGSFPAGAGETVRYKPLRTECSACHADVHRGQLDADCRRCHGLDAFRPAGGFDHRQARFSLQGFHEKVECRKCHPPERLPGAAASGETIRYKPVPVSCRECHRTLDHARTAFPLTGRHVDLECKACHNEHTPNTRGTRRTQAGEFACRVLPPLAPSRPATRMHRLPYPPRLEGGTVVKKPETGHTRGGSAMKRWFLLCLACTVIVLAAAYAPLPSYFRGTLYQDWMGFTTGGGSLRQPTGHSPEPDHAASPRRGLDPVGRRAQPPGPGRSREFAADSLRCQSLVRPARQSGFLLPGPDEPLRHRRHRPVDRGHGRGQAGAHPGRRRLWGSRARAVRHEAECGLSQVRRVPCVTWGAGARQFALSYNLVSFQGQGERQFLYGSTLLPLGQVLVLYGNVEYELAASVRPADRLSQLFGNLRLNLTRYADLTASYSSGRGLDYHQFLLDRAGSPGPSTPAMERFFYNRTYGVRFTIKPKGRLRLHFSRQQSEQQDLGIRNHTTGFGFSLSDAFRTGLSLYGNFNLNRGDSSEGNTYYLSASKSIGRASLSFSFANFYNGVRFNTVGTPEVVRIQLPDQQTISADLFFMVSRRVALSLDYSYLHQPQSDHHQVYVRLILRK